MSNVIERLSGPRNENALISDLHSQPRLCATRFDILLRAATRPQSSHDEQSRAAGQRKRDTELSDDREGERKRGHESGERAGAGREMLETRSAVQLATQQSGGSSATTGVS